MRSKSTSANRGRPRSGLAVLTLAALGVVFGDIGTSPLYAVDQVFFGDRPIATAQSNILGAISLALWVLTIIVTFKYITYVLRADNDGQGGVFALLTLLRKNNGRYAKFLTGGLMILSAGLLFGDGLITPSISVLSAVEGLQVAAPSLQHIVVPITIVILVGLFSIQFIGASRVGRYFGPIISVWFVAIALIGLRQIILHPGILAAANPVYAIAFLRHLGLKISFIVLGSIMLVVTGGEALYADMGHFGKTPIRIGWFLLVFPALILNYLGQGAYMLSGKPVIAGNLFFSLVPHTLLYPMVLLATVATIIASQALISGIFSLTTQGIALGLFPRLRVSHTHEDHEGQVYVPTMNWTLCLGCIALVIGFQTSANLASAYGLAVSGDMLITSLTMIVIASTLWGWTLIKSMAVFVPLAIIDATFLSANSLKFLHGGYVPVGVGLTMFTIMKSWQWGRRKVDKTYDTAEHITMKELVRFNRTNTQYFPRSVIILTPVYRQKISDKACGLMQIFIDRYGMMPRHVIMLNIQSAKVPHVDPKKRYRIKVFENDGARGTIASVKASFGFMELPNITEVINFLNNHPEVVVKEDLHNWVVFAGHEQLIDKTSGKFDKLRFIIFRILHSNSRPAYSYFDMDDRLSLVTEVVPVEL
jgi:KUP system potassium uptake protein